MNSRILVVSALLPLAASGAPSTKNETPPPAATRTDPTLEEGRTLTALLLRGEAEPIMKRFSPGLRERVPSAGQVVSLFDSWREMFGAETRVVYEKTDALAGTRRYLRTSVFDREKRPVEIAWAFNERDEVATVSMRLQQVEAATDKASYETKTRLRLPFDGEWTVWWGGRTIWQNIHAATPGQRFATDFFIVKEGRTHRGDGTKNEDYYAWGRPVLASAAGTVAAVQDGKPDGKPGHVDPAAEPPGNYVVLDHGDGEFSFLVHLQNGSIVVKPGAKVNAGDPLARAGSSGRTPEPVLHLHLQDGPDLAKGVGLPAVFHDYVADGKPVTKGEPVRAERVSPARR